MNQSCKYTKYFILTEYRHWKKQPFGQIKIGLVFAEDWIIYHIILLDLQTIIIYMLKVS